MSTRRDIERTNTTDGTLESPDHRGWLELEYELGWAEEHLGEQAMSAIDIDEDEELSENLVGQAMLATDIGDDDDLSENTEWA